MSARGAPPARDLAKKNRYLSKFADLLKKVKNYNQKRTRMVGCGALALCGQCGCKAKGAGLIIGAREANGQLLRCAGCKITWYCDLACQRQAWPQHKLICKLSAYALQRQNVDAYIGLAKVVHRDQVFLKAAQRLLVNLQHEETTWSQRASVAPRTLSSATTTTTENSENSAKAHLLMLRVYVFISKTCEDPGNKLVFTSVHDGRLNMQTHLDIATHLVHERGLIGYADELAELQALVTTTTAAITNFYASGVDIEFPAGGAPRAHVAGGAPRAHVDFPPGWDFDLA